MGGAGGGGASNILKLIENGVYQNGFSLTGNVYQADGYKYLHGDTVSHTSPVLDLSQYSTIYIESQGWDGLCTVVIGSVADNLTTGGRHTQTLNISSVTSASIQMIMQNTNAYCLIFNMWLEK